MPEPTAETLVEMERSGGIEPDWARRVSIDGSAWERHGDAGWQRLGHVGPEALGALEAAISSSGVLDLPDPPVGGEIVSDAARERWVLRAGGRARELDLRGAHRSAVPPLVAVDQVFQAVVAMAQQSGD